MIARVRSSVKCGSCRAGLVPSPYNLLKGEPGCIWHLITCSFYSLWDSWPWRVWKLGGNASLA